MRWERWRALWGAGGLLTAVAVTAACATGLEPDRSGFAAGEGGGATSGGTTSGGGATSTTTTTSSGGGGETSSSSTSTSGSGGGGGGAGSGGAGGGGSPIEDAGTDAPTPTGLRVQYKASATGATTNELKPHFNIVNDGPDTVALGELTLRYWYTLEPGSTTEVFACDYAQIGCGQVMAAFAAASGANADHALEITFAGGSLAAGQQTGEIQARFHKDNYSNYDQTNDYSFDPAKTSFADWDKVALYHNGALVWGIEP